MKSLTKVELNSLLEVAGKHSPSDRLWMTIAFNHGLRVSEVLALTDANVVAGSLVIQRLKGSRKTVQKLLPTERAEVEALAAKGGRFFHMHRKTAWLHFKQYCAEAGIPSYLSCHSLKHTTAKLGLAGGMKINELQTYLGHVNGANTMIYLQVDDEEASKAFAASTGGL
jgi:integrase